MVKVSVVIPTLNESGTIGQTIERCLAQTHRVDEIIVVDAGSTDSTVTEVLAYPEVRLIRHHPPVGGQRTLGGNEAIGDIIVFLDADVSLSPDFIERTVRDMEHNHLDIACPLYWPCNSTIPIRIVYSFFLVMFVLFQHVFPSGAGSCIIVRRSLFLETGGFDGTMKFDDIAFIRKAARRGKFRMLLSRVCVSDRRFRQYGTLRMLGVYLILSVLFMLGMFRAANRVSYAFGQYKKT